MPLGARALHPETAVDLASALRARILSSHSATAALEAWCAEVFGDGPLRALRVPGPDKPLAEAGRRRLNLAPDEPLRYRRVRLACGDRVLSEADNWYVPGRLTPAMNAALDGTRAPFGRVVRALAPVRRTLAVRCPPLAGRPGAAETLFEVEALLATAAGEPFCEVAETYLGGALPDPAAGGSPRG